MINRILDIVLASFFIILTSPIIISVFLINSFSGKPIFSQTRLGKNGKKIKVFKFRSMIINAEEVLKSDKKLYKLYVENNFKIPSELDPRITNFGNFIRKTSIDELPQFFNVLKGEMSVVGPRPIVEDELQNYFPNQDIILSVKPGITGLWQVSGRSTVISDTRVQLDLDYVKRKSLKLDIYIILKTPLKIFSRHGAF